MREVETGGAEAAHLAHAAKRSPRARAAMEAEPEFPDALAYLWGWVLELHGRSGIGMGGANPLTYTTIADWAILTRNRPQPYEVEALVALDGALYVATEKPERDTKGRLSGMLADKRSGRRG